MIPWRRLGGSIPALMLRPEMPRQINSPPVIRIAQTPAPDVGTDGSGQHHNHCRYHESIASLTPAGVCLGRGRAILIERERIKRQTIAR